MFYYFHRLLFKTGFFKRINLTLTTVINNRKFIIPVINQVGYGHMLPHEKWMILLMKDILQTTEGAVIDVGMNIGQTLLKVASIDSQRRYIGFEPNPLCYHYCSRLSEVNKFKNHTFYPVGLFDTTKILTLYMDMDIAAGASVLEGFRENKQRYNRHINVPVFCADEIEPLKNESKIAVIKADVEGAELEVVKSLMNLIQNHHPLLILEILPVYNLNKKYGVYRKKRQDELLGILKENDYLLFLIDESKMKIIQLEDIEVHGSMSRTNYLFVHETNKQAIRNFSSFGVIN